MNPCILGPMNFPHHYIVLITIGAELSKILLKVGGGLEPPPPPPGFGAYDYDQDYLTDTVTCI